MSRSRRWRLEPRLRVVAFGHVLDDERQIIRIAAIDVHHDVVHHMRPARLVDADRRHLDDDVREVLARQHPHDRIVAPGEALVVAIAQAETLAILVRRRAERVGLRHAMHRQRRRVGADDRTGRIDEDDADGKPRHQLFQMTQGGRVGRMRMSLAHAASSPRQRLGFRPGRDGSPKPSVTE